MRWIFRGFDHFWSFAQSASRPPYEGDTEGPVEEGYAATRAFYQAVGFLAVCEVPLF
jgi:hypothetical protein